jgi:hypothetical protein
MGRAIRMAVGLLSAVATLAAGAGPAIADQLFAPSSYRNTPLAANAPLDWMSRAYVFDVATKASSLGAYVNDDAYSTPVYTVPADQPVTQVIVDDPRYQLCGYGNPCLVEQWRAVPLPANPVPSPGTDGHLVVYQPSTDTVWEFWRFKLVGGRPHAYFGGRLPNVSTNPGHFTSSPGTRYGASATSIPLLVGLQRISELEAGAIEHVVDFAISDPQRGFRFPAQRGDGTSWLVTAPPEGTCFRLPANLNLASFELTPYGLTLARAIQKYGLVLRDRTAPGVVVYAEMPTDGSDPYTGPDGIFGGLDNTGGPGGVLRNFPWNQLQALAAGTC